MAAAYNLFAKLTIGRCKENSERKEEWKGSGFGSVGRAVTFYTRGPGFEHSRWQTFI